MARCGADVALSLPLRPVRFRVRRPTHARRVLSDLRCWNCRHRFLRARVGGAVFRRGALALSRAAAAPTALRVAAPGAAVGPGAAGDAARRSRPRRRRPLRFFALRSRPTPPRARLRPPRRPVARRLRARRPLGALRPRRNRRPPPCSCLGRRRPRRRAPTLTGLCPPPRPPPRHQLRRPHPRRPLFFDTRDGISGGGRPGTSSSVVLVASYDFSVGRQCPVSFVSCL
mmetsp:Transcript_14238/g.43109  ORF Transcript_14238/g.43109 Transcript_14238/m.43109 type:complete len:228 (+) Transcript_14238:865-1548(+)